MRNPAQLVVRNLEPGVKARLQRRARRHGRSMEEEVRDILRNAVETSKLVAPRLGSRISSRFRDVGLDRVIEPLRWGPARPARFSK